MTSGLDRPPAKVRFNPFAAEFRRNPYPRYRELREAAPVHRALGMWVLTRHTDVRAVLHDRSFAADLIPRLVAERAGVAADPDMARVARLAQGSLVFTEGPEHARLRGLVNRVFTRAAVEGLRDAVAARVRDMAERLPAAGTGDVVDVVEAFAAPLPVAVLTDWMALPPELAERVPAWTHDVRFLLEPGLVQPAGIARVAGVVAGFTAALEAVVAERRADPGDDLVSRLLAARAGSGDRFTAEEIAFLCIMCFVAGTETTTALIGSAVLTLLRHPREIARLRTAPAHASAMVAETLRHQTPLQLTKRVATRTRLIADQEIRPGDQVLLCLGAANRDPAVFPRPDDFDSTRDTRAHLAFGHGMHGCLGSGLATLQATVALEELGRRGFGWRPAPGDDVVWQDHSLILRGPARLPVVAG